MFLFKKKTQSQSLKDFKIKKNIPENNLLKEHARFAGKQTPKFVIPLVEFYFKNEETLSAQDKEEINEFFNEMHKSPLGPKYYNIRDKTFTEIFPTKEDFYEKSNIKTVITDENAMRTAFSAMTDSYGSKDIVNDYDPQSIATGGKKTKRRRHTKKRRHTKRRRPTKRRRAGKSS